MFWKIIVIMALVCSAGNVLKAIQTQNSDAMIGWIVACMLLFVSAVREFYE